MSLKKLFNVKYVMFNVFLLYTLHFTLYTGFAQAVSSRELINNSKQYDGKSVVYQGEAIGDIMRRKGFAWVNLLDGESAIGIWLKQEEIPKIKFIGGYQHKGDLIEVEGVFNSNCREHGGDLDIHADKITVVTSGYSVSEEINPVKKVWAKNLSFVTAFFLICFILREAWDKWKKK